MMRWVIGSSLKARGFMLFLAALVIALGIAQLRDVSEDVLPEFSPPTVEVQTEALGLSAMEVEELITVPLEQDLLNGVAFLHTIKSASIPGLSSIEMVFEPGTDILDARQVVEERLTQAHALPQVSKPPQMLQPVSSTSRVMLVGLTSDELSLIDMSLLARWNIRPRLMGVPGVANVSVWGQRERQLQVLVDPARLRAHDVSLQQIIETSANAQFVSNLTFVEASTPGTGGIIETPNQRFGIQHGVPFASPADLAKVIVQDTGGTPLRLGDVTDIVVDHQPLIGDAVFSDGPGLLLVVEKLPGANPVEVTRGVESALDDLRPGLSGITIDTSLLRPGTYIESSSNNLTTALIIGALLLLLALGAFLFAWRTALIAVVAMATSLLAAVLVLTWTHTTFNSMIVAGLILALVVVIDDAVGDTENVARRIRGRRAEGAGGPGLPALIVRDAFIEMRSAGLYALLISLVVLVPVFFTRGAFGAFFPSIAVAYAVAVVCSMVVALVVTPALGLTLLATAPTDVRESPIVRWLRPRYQRGVSRVLASARPAFVLAGVILLIGLLAVPFLERSFTPEFKDTNLLVRLSGPPGTSLPEMDRITALMSDEIRTIPGVLDVGGHAGRALLSDQVVGTEASELWVTVDPEADYDATRASIDDVVHGYTGLNRDVVTYPSARIDRVLGGSNDPITVRIFGQDLGILRTKAEEVKQVLSGIDGIEDPQVAVTVRGADARDRGRPGRGRAVRDRAGRRSASGGDAAVGHPGRQPLRRPEGVRRRGVGNGGGPTRSVQRPRPRDRHARGSAGAVGRHRRRPDRVLPHRHPTRRRLPEHRRHRRGVGSRSRSHHRRRAGRDCARSSSRWNTTRPSSGTTRPAGPRIGRRWASRSPQRSPSSCWCRHPSATGAWRRSSS